MDDSTFDAKRRNLLAITVVLCFFKYAQARIQPAATVSALSVSLGHPEAILQLIWFLWAYFYLRAYQHFSYHLSMDYKRAIQKTIIPVLHPYVAVLGIPEEHEKYFFEDLERFHKYELKFSPKGSLRTLAWLLGTPWRWLFARKAGPRRVATVPLMNFIRYAAVPTGIRPRNAYDWSPWVVRVWTVSDRPADAPAKMEIGLSAQQPLPFWEGLRCQLRLLLRLTVLSAPFFDFRLPFLLALAPVPYYLFVD